MKGRGTRKDTVLRYESLQSSVYPTGDGDEEEEQLVPVEKLVERCCSRPRGREEEKRASDRFCGNGESVSIIISKVKEGGERRKGDGDPITTGCNSHLSVLLFFVPSFHLYILSCFQAELLAVSPLFDVEEPIPSTREVKMAERSMRLGPIRRFGKRVGRTGKWSKSRV